MKTINENGITTRELTAMTGTSPGTQNTYVRFGWIQAPQLTPYGKGNGRGSRLVWGKHVVKRVEEIQSYKALGHSLEQIDAILKGEKVK